MSNRTALTNYLRDILPLGRFWEGAPAERFIDGTAGAFENVVDLLCTLDRETAPFFAQRPVLLQWLEYLRRVDCVATPVDTEALRDRVEALLAAESSAFPAGLEATILSYLPLVEVRDDLPLSILGFSSTSAGPPLYLIPAPLDPHWAVVEVWYAPLIYSKALVICVARPFAPAVSVIRPVAPTAMYSHPQPSNTRADAIALHWREMRAVTDITMKRLLLPSTPLEQHTTTGIEVADAKTMDELFPLLNPADDVSGQQFTADFTRTWADQSAAVIQSVVEVA